MVRVVSRKAEKEMGERRINRIGQPVTAVQHQYLR